MPRSLNHISAANRAPLMQVNQVAASESVGFSQGGIAPRDQKLWSEPNKFARAPGIEVKGDKMTIHGYQEFKISLRNMMPKPMDHPLRRKKRLVQAFFDPEFLTGKKVLDMGANGGFFSFWACQSGASQVVSLDMDEAYLDLIRQGQTALGWKQIRPIHEKAQNWQEPADLVLAFAMIHWLYSCTANFGSLDAVVARLADLTRSLLLIEWVAPDDAAILAFKHTEWNPQVDKGGYNIEAFEAAMRRHFRKVEVIGPTSSTRVLYAAYRQSHEVTLHPILPMLAPADRVIASRCLCEYKGTKYYSRVYADASYGRIIKQATSNLAQHEARILERLQQEYFPRVISAEQHSGYSILILERMHGADLDESRSEIASSPKRLVTFIKECLVILRQLRAAAVRHRDIRLENVWVRDGEAVLIDFGWAETEDQPFLSPGGLGGLERIPEGPACDTYSMGRVFEQIIPQNSELFSPLLGKMLDPAWARRGEITELEQILRNLALPEAWDVPLVFPLPRHPAARPGAPTMPTGILAAEAARFRKRCRAFYHKIFRC